MFIADFRFTMILPIMNIGTLSNGAAHFQFCTGNYSFLFMHAADLNGVQRWCFLVTLKVATLVDERSCIYKCHGFTVTLTVVTLGDRSNIYNLHGFVIALRVGTVSEVKSIPAVRVSRVRRRTPLQSTVRCWELLWRPYLNFAPESVYFSVLPLYKTLTSLPVTEITNSLQMSVLMFTL